jgi:putative ABC transport system ATP-binding protein
MLGMPGENSGSHTGQIATKQGVAPMGDGQMPPGVVIDLRDVTKVYQVDHRDVTVLKGITLRVHAGEFVGVLGPSGSGKSTLLNMVTGIDRPTSGEVIVGGEPIHLLSQNQLARWRGRNVGVIFQFFQLVPTLTIVENVMLPMDFCGVYRPYERVGRAVRLLEEVGIVAHATKLPSSLSGGEQQRAAIARALANDPPIVVADEPTGNLDSKTAAAVLDLFADLTSQGKTIVMVTHDLQVARRVTSTVMLRDGALVDNVANRVTSEPSLVPALRQEQPDA